MFAICWSAIELTLPYGGYTLLRRKASPARNAALGLWALNTALIGGWSVLFFGRKALEPNAVAAGAMMATGAVYAAVTAPVDRRAAAAALPVIAWVGFATMLAEEVWRRNDARQRGSAALTAARSLLGGPQFGRRTIFPATAGLRQGWTARTGRRSANFTTRLEELPVAKA